MKKFFFILIFAGLTTSIFAQIPEGFSYQAVIRDNNGTLVKSQTVAVKASILRNNEVVFTQTLNAVTNDNGLMTLTIGGTTEFSEIDWTNGPLIIKTQIDPTGGDNYTIETTAPLLTVPYSMAAKTAEKALNVPDLDNLLERINNLENQVEELYFIMGLKLVGTEWKLLGIVDVQTGDLTVLEPKECAECYSFTFNTDSTASGWSTSNYLIVELKPIVRIIILTDAGEYGDGYLFQSAIATIISYELNVNELKFYYNENKNYLKFKKIGG